MKIKDLISFIRVINNSSELYVLEKIIRKGYLITDIKIDFDDAGKIKDNYSINGLVKDIEIDFFNKYNVKDLSFIFNFENKKLTTNDSSFKFNDLVFSSEEISVKKINRFSNAPSSGLISRFKNKIPRKSQRRYEIKLNQFYCSATFPTTIATNTATILFKIYQFFFIF